MKPRLNSAFKVAQPLPPLSCPPRAGLGNESDTEPDKIMPLGRGGFETPVILLPGTGFHSTEAQPHS